MFVQCTKLRFRHSRFPAYPVSDTMLSSLAAAFRVSSGLCRDKTNLRGLFAYSDSDSDSDYEYPCCVVGRWIISPLTFNFCFIFLRRLSLRQALLCYMLKTGMDCYEGWVDRPASARVLLGSKARLPCNVCPVCHSTALIESFKLHCHHGNQLLIINYQLSSFDVSHGVETESCGSDTLTL
jgi:hypothetical protein